MTQIHHDLQTELESLYFRKIKPLDLLRDLLRESWKESECSINYDKSDIKLDDTHIISQSALQH